MDRTRDLRWQIGREESQSKGKIRPGSTKRAIAVPRRKGAGGAVLRVNKGNWTPCPTIHPRGKKGNGYALIQKSNPEIGAPRQTENAEEC